MLTAIRQQAITLLTQPQRIDNGLAAALVCGWRGALDEETYRDFQVSGLAHVVAVSGAHLSIMVAFVASAVRLLKLPRNLSMALQISLVLAYLVLTAVPVSAVRAAVMTIAGLLSLDGAAAASFVVFAIRLHGGPHRARPACGAVGFVCAVGFRNVGHRPIRLAHRSLDRAHGTTGSRFCARSPCADVGVLGFSNAPVRCVVFPASPGGTACEYGNRPALRAGMHGRHPLQHGGACVSCRRRVHGCGGLRASLVAALSHARSSVYPVCQHTRHLVFRCRAGARLRLRCGAVAVVANAKHEEAPAPQPRWACASVAGCLLVGALLVAFGQNGATEIIALDGAGRCHPRAQQREGHPHRYR